MSSPWAVCQVRYTTLLLLQLSSLSHGKAHMQKFFQQYCELLKVATVCTIKHPKIHYLLPSLHSQHWKGKNLTIRWDCKCTTQFFILLYGECPMALDGWFTQSISYTGNVLVPYRMQPLKTQSKWTCYKKPLKALTHRYDKSRKCC